MKTRTAVVNASAAIFLFLFTYTATSKLISFPSFRNTLSRSPLIGHYSKILAIILPIIELFASGLLFFPKTRLAGLYLSLGLMILFSFYIGYMLSFESNLPCSCGGVLRQFSWKQHLWFNLFFTGLAALAIKLNRGADQTEHKILLQ